MDTAGWILGVVFSILVFVQLLDALVVWFASKAVAEEYGDDEWLDPEEH